jgi:hypothetical protein
LTFIVHSKPNPPITVFLSLSLSLSLSFFLDSNSKSHFFRVSTTRSRVFDKSSTKMFRSNISKSQPFFALFLCSVGLASTERTLERERERERISTRFGLLSAWADAGCQRQHRRRLNQSITLNLVTADSLSLSAFLSIVCAGLSLVCNHRFDRIKLPFSSQCRPLPPTLLFAICLGSTLSAGIFACSRAQNCHSLLAPTSSPFSYFISDRFLSSSPLCLVCVTFSRCLSTPFPLILKFNLI